MEAVFCIGLFFSFLVSVRANACFSQNRKKDITMCMEGLVTKHKGTVYIDTFNEAILNTVTVCTCVLSTPSDRTLIHFNILAAGQYSNYHLEVGGTNYTDTTTNQPFALVKGTQSEIKFIISPLPEQASDIPRLCLEIVNKGSGMIKVACTDNGRKPTTQRSTTSHSTLQHDPVTRPSTDTTDNSPSQDNDHGDPVTRPSTDTTDNCPPQDNDHGVLIAVICAAGTLFLSSAVAAAIVCRRRKTRAREKTEKPDDEHESDILMTENELYNCEMAIPFNPCPASTALNKEPTAGAACRDADSPESKDQGIYNEIDEGEDKTSIII